MPPLHLQELKIRQEVHLIRNAELAFTAKETRSYLQTVRRLLLPYDLVVQLHESTEGWVGGLVLLCETLEHLPAEAREKFISQGLNEDFREQVHAYFQESIFSSRPAKIQDFLVRSSILEVVEPDFIQEYLGQGTVRPEVSRFHEVFLESIKLGGGRLSEPLLLGLYTLKSGQALEKFKSGAIKEELSLAWELVRRGRLVARWPQRLRGRKEIKGFFR
jgi:hypothetical protein